MIKKREALLGTTHTRVAALKPTDNTETMAFTIISDDNGGLRYDWMEGEHYEEVLDISGANSERLTTFFKDHDRSVDSAIGRIDNVRVDNSELVANVTFGTDEGSQTIADKYRNGILTDVSIGYSINNYTVAEREGQPDLVTVTDFTIFEVSAVGIGFDSGANKREKDIKLKGETSMKKEIETPEVEAKEVETPEVDTRAAEELDTVKREAAEAKAQVVELERQKEIASIGASSKASTEVIDRYIEDASKTAEDFMRHLLSQKEKETEKAVAHVPDESETMARSVSDAILVKLGGKAEMAKNQYQGASLLDLGRELTGYAGYDKLELAKRFMVTTDFPVLLVESGNRYLEQEWERQALTYKLFVKEVDLPDFKQVKDVTRAGAGGRLDKITEGGELTEKQFSEQAEAWNLESFGNKFVLTREMIINDDLGAFTNMLQDFVEMAGATANGRVYDLIRKVGDYASYTMADGLPIFDAGHGGNSINTALSPEGLRAGKVVMRRQVGADGSTPLNIAPSFLLVPPELEQTALQILNSTADLGDSKNSGVINTEYKMVTPIVDAEMATADEWYLLASRRTIKVGYLAGTGRMPQLQVNSTSLTQTVFEGIFDFGTMAEDYRGSVKGK